MNIRGRSDPANRFQTNWRIKLQESDPNFSWAIDQVRGAVRRIPGLCGFEQFLGNEGESREFLKRAK